MRQRRLGDDVAGVRPHHVEAEQQVAFRVADELGAAAR
jgi:hypothetical protein